VNYTIIGTSASLLLLWITILYNTRITFDRIEPIIKICVTDFLVYSNTFSTYTIVQITIFPKIVRFVNNNYTYYLVWIMCNLIIEKSASKNTYYNFFTQFSQKIIAVVQPVQKKKNHSNCSWVIIIRMICSMQ